MDVIELIYRLAVALAIGAVIGLERGWTAREEAEGERTAGIRTLALTGLLGGVWGALAKEFGEAGAIALAAAFVAFTAAFTLFRYREAVADRTFGVTTVVAGMLAFALGAFAVAGEMQAAAAGGVAVAVILASKSQLHTWLQRLSWKELRSVLVLLVMTVILLPLLPNRAVDPWEAVNPFQIWLLTVMIAAISFVGYVALKLAGQVKGALITAVAGGLASSTAVTVTMARLARDHPEHATSLLAGVLIAAATMLTRVLVVVAIIHFALVTRLLLPLGLAACAFVAMAFFVIQRRTENGEDGGAVKLKNPLDLPMVFRFGALLTVVTVLGKIAASHAGAAGVYALAFVSGIVDVDAITLSMSQISKETLDMGVAASAILIVVTVNTVAKAGLAWIGGGAAFGLRTFLASTVAIAAGLLGLWFAQAL